MNPVDTYIRAGTHSRQPKLPYTPGLDSAGEVTRVGENIKDFKVSLLNKRQFFKIFFERNQKVLITLGRRSRVYN